MTKKYYKSGLTSKGIITKQDIISQYLNESINIDRPWKSGYLSSFMGDNKRSNVGLVRRVYIYNTIN